MACRWCSAGQCWTHGQTAMPAGMARGKGQQLGASNSAFGAAPSKKRRVQRKPIDPNAPMQPLDDIMLHRITEHLHANGGICTSGNVTCVFPGVKRAQLEQFFTVVPTEGGNYNVALDSTSATGTPAPSKRSHGKGTSQARNPGVAIQQKSQKPRARAAFDPNAPPAQPLDVSTLVQISKYISTQPGRQINLGKLGNTFPGVKKSQLDGHFRVDGIAQGNQMRGYVVSII
eukprot:TRINITY_DN2304_c0_g1_i1.p1 TRINITY_DN2304_c0_g1~~TRINITY_DN2304_c0_g1_i1.p1  ORF type:complete len:230 (-),score=33.12 TRINITY_DN2304_c0_g1_i1:182-871(-)